MDLTNVKKGWIALVVAISAFALGFTLVGCSGASDEELITQAVDEEMSIIVDPSDETISMLADEAESGASGTFESMEIDSTELVKSWIDGFTYSVGEIEVDGDTATAEVTISCKQLGPIMTEWVDSFQDDALEQGFTTMDEIYAYAGKTIMEQIDAADLTDTTVTFELTKDGSTWTVDQSSANQAVLEDAMIGEYSF